MRIPFFDYPNIYTRFKKEFNTIFEEVCSRGAFILQDDLEKFEENLASYVNIKHAIGVADGTNALVFGLKASGIQPGQEVIISPHTYIATAAAIKIAGGQPICGKIDKHGYLDGDSLGDFFSDKTFGVMPTQLNGFCSNMRPIRKFCEDYKVKLFEDSAQGLGASFENTSAGSFGEFGTLSFYPAKLIGCFGDGGAVLTNSDSVNDFVRAYRDHGRHSGEYVGLGTNGRLDNLQAAFLKFRLSKYDEDIERRQAIAQKYNEAFCGFETVVTPKEIYESKDHYGVFQNYEIQISSRDEFKKYLDKNGIGTLVQWGGHAVYDIPDFHDCKKKGYDYLNEDRFFRESLMLPMHMGLTDLHVKYITDVIKAYAE